MESSSLAVHSSSSRHENQLTMLDQINGPWLKKGHRYIGHNFLQYHEGEGDGSSKSGILVRQIIGWLPQNTMIKQKGGIIPVYNNNNDLNHYQVASLSFSGDEDPASEEFEIIFKEQALKNTTKDSKVKTVITAAKIIEFRNLVQQISIEENLLRYIANIVVNTRSNSFLYLGASPRASIAILNASKAFAAVDGRDFVTPEDIKKATLPVLQHRVIVTPEREMEGLSSKQIIDQIIEAVEIPR